MHEHTRTNTDCTVVTQLKASIRLRIIDIFPELGKLTQSLVQSAQAQLGGMGAFASVSAAFGMSTAAAAKFGRTAAQAAGVAGASTDQACARHQAFTKVAELREAIAGARRFEREAYAAMQATGSDADAAQKYFDASSKLESLERALAAARRFERSLRSTATAAVPAAVLAAGLCTGFETQETGDDRKGYDWFSESDFSNLVRDFYASAGLGGGNEIATAVSRAVGPLLNAVAKQALVVPAIGAGAAHAVAWLQGGEEAAGAPAGAPRKALAPAIIPPHATAPLLPVLPAPPPALLRAAAPLAGVYAPIQPAPHIEPAAPIHDPAKEEGAHAGDSREKRPPPPSLRKIEDLLVASLQLLREQASLLREQTRVLERSQRELRESLRRASRINGGA